MLPYYFSIMGLPSVGMGENAGPMKVVKAARVLRPLKLVSGVPSKLYFLKIEIVLVFNHWNMVGKANILIRVATVWKIREKTCFFKIFLENQGKSGNVRENFCSL